MNKPRTKGRLNIDVGIPEGYKNYINYLKTENSEQRYYVDKAKYNKIIKDLHKIIAKKILEESATFRMPCGLPAIRIKKYKRKVRFKEDGSIDPKSLAINWKKTMELWESNSEAKLKKKLVYFINDHTDGYSARFTMEKYAANIKNLPPYSFKSCRDNDRALAGILLNPYNKIDYYL